MLWNSIFGLFVAWVFVPGLSMGQGVAPKFEIDSPTITEGRYVILQPKTDAVSVAYVGQSGREAVPTQLMKDSRLFVFDTCGVPNDKYLFTAMASNKEGNQFPFHFAVKVEKKQPDPPKAKAEPTITVADHKKALAAAKKKAAQDALTQKQAEDERAALEEDVKNAKESKEEVQALAAEFRSLAKEVEGSGDGYTVACFEERLGKVRNTEIAKRLQESFRFFDLEACKLNLPAKPIACICPEQKVAIAKLYNSYARLLEAIR